MKSKIKILIYGPYFTNYSLAKVNRDFAIALSRNPELDVKIYCDPKTIDYLPSENELNKFPELKPLVGQFSELADFVIYNNFPKTQNSLHGLANLPGKIKLAYLAWEESVFPKIWANEINQNLHGLLVMTTFVKEVFEKSGVQIPIEILSVGTSPELLSLNKNVSPIGNRVKFLNISSGKMRKGIDILIRAFTEEFTQDENVELVIKSFPNPDNKINELIDKFSNENSAKITYLNKDMSFQEIIDLILDSSIAVYPTRAEGFGMPMLEALYLEKPLIVTNYSGHLDFCNSENSFLVDAKIVNAIDSELFIEGSKWGDPDISDLRRKMRFVYENLDSEIVKRKVLNGKKVAINLVWENNIKVLFPFLEKISRSDELKSINIGILTPFNDETGIADYSMNLYKSIRFSFNNLFIISNKDIADRVRLDDTNVFRTWEIGCSEFKETLEIIKEKEIDLVHIQYHSGSSFSPEILGKLIDQLKNLGVRIYLTFHALRGPNFDYIKTIPNLSDVNKIFIHNPLDYEYASKSLKNTLLFIHPCEKNKIRDKDRLKKELNFNKNDLIITTHGLLNSNKNIPEMIQAIFELKKEFSAIKYFALNAVSSNNLLANGIYKDCINLIKEYNLEDTVYFVSDFLKKEEIEILLQASDIVVFNYSDAGESASGSIRKALASGNPIIATDIPMFVEFTDEIYRIKNSDPKTIILAVRELIYSKEIRERMVKKSSEFITNNTYSKKALEMLKIYSVN